EHEKTTMIEKNAVLFALLLTSSAIACSKGGGSADAPPSDTDGAKNGDGSGEDLQPGEDLSNVDEGGNPGRPEITSEECKARGGEIVGDIGDGAIYQEAYTCPSGEVPWGNI